MNVDEQLDLIFDTFNDLFWANNFEQADKILSEVEDYSSIDLIIGYLVASLPAKDKLPNRRQMLQTAQKRFPDPRGELFQGLS